MDVSQCSRNSKNFSIDKRDTILVKTAPANHFFQNFKIFPSFVSAFPLIEDRVEPGLQSIEQNIAKSSKGEEM
jgi:hypothetical protein